MPATVSDMAHPRDTMRWDAVKEAYRLCPRELEVLRLLYDGLINKQIASQLGIERSTVATYIRRIYAKVGPRRRDQVLLEVARVGLSDD